jgi:hypothetical protein
MRHNVDVILPFHRTDHLFREALSSLSRSNGVSLRLILVDDSIQQKFDLSQIRDHFGKIEYVRTGGGLGYGKALQFGTSFVESDAVGLFNSDDLVDPFRFKYQIESLANFELSITGMQRISENGKKGVSLSGDLYSRTYDPIYLSLGSYGANSTWLARRDWWEKNAFFDTNECLDWRIALGSFNKTRIHWNPNKLYHYRKHKDQVTAQKKIESSRMEPVYKSWKDFCDSLGLVENTRSVFDLMATPWLVNESTDLYSVQLWVKNFFTLAKEKDKNVYLNLRSLMRRRFLNIALRKDCNFSSRLNFAYAGIPEIPFLARDFLSLIQI